MNIFDFMAAHPFLTWLLAWGLWPVCLTIKAILTAPFVYSFRAYNRSLRARNIAIHGWPTAPLMDADGDIVHPPVEEARR